MKKAKIALTAVAVLAVVGGALAFKAQRSNSISVYVQEGTKKQCTYNTLINDRTLIDQGLGTFTGVKFSTTTTLATCPVQTIYSLQ